MTRPLLVYELVASLERINRSWEGMEGIATWPLGIKFNCSLHGDTIDAYMGSGPEWDVNKTDGLLHFDMTNMGCRSTPKGNLTRRCRNYWRVRVYITDAIAGPRDAGWSG